jgi:hypothetical protein
MKARWLVALISLLAMASASTSPGKGQDARVSLSAWDDDPDNPSPAHPDGPPDPPPSPKPPPSRIKPSLTAMQEAAPPLGRTSEVDERCAQSSVIRHD